MHEGLKYRDLSPELLNKFPEFHADADDVHEGTTYLIYDAFIRWLFQLDPAAQTQALTSAFGFLEQAADSGEPEVQYLVRDVAETIIEQPRISEFEQFFGPKLAKFVEEAR